ncbi:uncharacterized protein LOC121432151 [Lytechinus variegatus]|uniref:uncharacterized protein LOC121432151 n=1 Tax=Lytechinus variegatus TaxID=7654 RepID=UPI001BB2895F|nr:uncharacterized protein LOC121432151 [Lytechinus variegatus]
MTSTLTRNWGWVVTFASFLVHFSAFGIMNCFSITFVTLQEEFSTSSTATSWAGSIAFGLGNSAGLIVTPLINRFENRPVAVFGILLASTSFFSTSFITDFRLIYLTYSAIYGLGAGFCSLASMDLLLRYFPRKHCSRATLIALVGGSTGMLVLGPLTYTLIEKFGWRNMFRFLGALMLLIALPATMTFSRPNPHKNECTADKRDVTQEKKFSECRGPEKRITFDNANNLSPRMVTWNPGDVKARLNNKERILKQGRSIACVTAYDNEGFSMEGINRREQNNGNGHQSEIHMNMEKGSADMVLADELMDSKDKGQVLRNELGFSTDLSEEGKVGLKHLGPLPSTAPDLVTNVERGQPNQQSTPQVNDLQNVTAVQPIVLSIHTVAEDDVAPFTTISISTNIQCHTISVSAIQCVSERKEDTPLQVVQSKNLEAASGRGFFQRYKALFYPDLWLICICITGLPMMNTFYYINMGDFLISRGFERHVIPWVVTTFGISELAGKVLLAVVADRLPFPKIFIYNFACAVGMVVMGCLLVVRSVALLICLAVAIGMVVMMVADALAYSICNQIFKPEDAVQTWTVVMVTQGLGYMLGSLFGQSTDRTGSYNSAIYSSIGIYAICALVCTAVPLYQKFFAPERFVMFENQDACRRKQARKKRYKPDDLVSIPV